MSSVNKKGTDIKYTRVGLLLARLPIERGKKIAQPAEKRPQKNGGKRYLGDEGVAFIIFHDVMAFRWRSASLLTIHMPTTIHHSRSRFYGGIQHSFLRQCDSSLP
eukprot:scaffold3953_cov169-Amphora_coffeaeformis.AAC.33